MSIRITCITKSSGYHHADPHHAIERLGWINEESRKTGNNTRLELYDWIKNEQGQAYVLDSRGNKAVVDTRKRAGQQKYLQTAEPTRFGPTISLHCRSASKAIALILDLEHGRVFQTGFSVIVHPSRPNIDVPWPFWTFAMSAPQPRALTAVVS